ncbi:MAG: hypothetical protein ACJA2D_002494 [Pseudohongiellaceae bacterium]|jgi:hypothetical protein
MTVNERVRDQWHDGLADKKNATPPEQPIESIPKNKKEFFFEEYFDSLGQDLTSWTLHPNDVEQIVSAMTTFHNDDNEHAEGGLGAGYTYLGQLVTHDITFDSKDFVDGELKPENQRVTRENFTPYLDLGCIYPILEPQSAGKVQLMQFSRMIDEEGRFILGEAVGAPKFSESDLLRQCDTYADIPEHRNDENVIVSQLHLFWQQIHNKAVHLISVTGSQMSGIEKYHSARKFVTLLFQKIVTDDFLSRILDPSVYERCYLDGVLSYGKSYQNKLNQGKVEELPQEFSMALFRFGHAMVRQKYKLNSDERSQDIGALFRKSKPLPKEFKIQWELFFSVQGRDAAVNRAKVLGLDLAKGLTSVPVDKPDADAYKAIIKVMHSIMSPEQRLSFEDTYADYFQREHVRVEVFAEQSASCDEVGNSKQAIESTKLKRKFKNLIVSDLLASRGLPTGRDIHKVLTGFFNDDRDFAGLRGKLSIPPKDVFYNQMQFSRGSGSLQDVTLQATNEGLTIDKCPLWLFMLLEAEVWSVTTRGMRDRARLGPIASLVVAETLRVSMEGAHTNIFQEPSCLITTLGPLSDTYTNLVSGPHRLSMGTLINFFNL